MNMPKLLTATGVYFRLGSKGDRFKLILDDVVLDPKVKDEIDKSIATHATHPNKPVLSIQDLLRKKRLEIWVK